MFPDEFACSRCRMKYRADGFKVNRLGHRLKTCIQCGVRRKLVADRNRCEHGRQRSRCKLCGGSSICEHGRRRDQCKPCGGSQICQHDSRLSTCWTCRPVGALWDRATARVQDVGLKKRDAVAILGCTPEEYFAFIESQFSLPQNAGMCLARISEIEIDHCMPLKFGDPTPDEVRARLHYQNTQVLWSKDNQAKGDRWVDPPIAPKPPPLPLTDADIDELFGW